MASPRHSADSAKRALDAHDPPPATTLPHPQSSDALGHAHGHGHAAAPTKRLKREHSCEKDAEADTGSGKAWTSHARSTPRIGAMGKGVNDHRWARLPTKIIQRILTDAMSDAPMPLPMAKRWKAQPQSGGTIAQTHCTRRWLGELRGMCHWWRDAIDSMSFWDSFYGVYGVTAPSLNFRSSIRPSPFHLARKYASRACLPCSIGFGAFRAADPSDTLWSAALGWIPVCAAHDENFCHDCFDTHSDVVVCDEHDQDAEGAWRERDTYLCPECRLFALEAHLRRELESCARGGVVRGASNPWHDSNQYEQYARGYGTAQGTANQLLVMMALRSLDPVRYEQCLALVEELQALDYKHRAAYVQAQMQGWPHVYAEKRVHPREDLARRRAIYDVLQPYDGYDANADMNERVRFFVQWQTDYNNGLYEEDPRELSLKYRRVLYYACIDGFIADRISSGIWVFPSVEVLHLSSTSADPPRELIDGTLVDVARLVDSAQHPMGELRAVGGFWTLDAAPACAVDNLRILKRRNHPEQFLPPPSVLQHLDERFRVRLASTLAPALARIVDITWSLLGDDISPRRVEMVLSKWSFARLLEVLAQADSWTAREPEPVSYAKSTSASTPTLSVKLGGRGSFTPASPRVELVAEEMETGTVVVDAMDELDASIEIGRGGTGSPLEDELELEVEVGRGLGNDTGEEDRAANDKYESVAYSDTEGSESDPEELSLSDDELEPDPSEAGSARARAGSGAAAGARARGGRAGHPPPHGGTGPRLVVPWSLVPSVPQLRAAPVRGKGAVHANGNGHDGHEHGNGNGIGNGMNGTNGTNETNGTGPNGTGVGVGATAYADSGTVVYDSDDEEDKEDEGISPDDEAAKMLAQELIMHLWFRERETLRVCRCRICERGRAVRAAMM